jgi:predicted RNA-binding Zn-ribbon protein involved in translation (DUF1610 family)
MAVLRYYGRSLTLADVKQALGTNEDGTSMAPMERLLRRKGLAVTRYARMSMADLERALGRGVVIVEVDCDHVAVVHDIDHRNVHIADSAVPRCPGLSQTRDRFRKRWDHKGLVVTDPVNGRPTPPMHVPHLVECPLTGDAVEVAPEDGDYECPGCGEDITVSDGEAAHVELDIFACPVTGWRTGVPVEDEDESDSYFECPECSRPVQSLTSGTRRHLLHAIDFG